MCTLKDTAIGFDEIIKKYNKKIIEGYKVRISENNEYIYITEKVINLIFKKIWNVTSLNKEIYMK